jgi:hypothetical protein
MTQVEGCDSIALALNLYQKPESADESDDESD